MKRIMLIQPWNYHDVSRINSDISSTWINGPYNLLCLSSYLRANRIPVLLVDLKEKLIHFQGNLSKCLNHLKKEVQSFEPDIIGVSFFSYQVCEAKEIVSYIKPIYKSIFIAGGIHATVEPEHTVKELGFDYAFVGEGEIGLKKIGYGEPIEKISGVYSISSNYPEKGKEIKVLDDLPFPDWSFCNYKFYSSPSSGKLSQKKVKTLDLMASRGCIKKCSFCAYSALSCVRFFSKEYIIKLIKKMVTNYEIDSVYFLDSSIGNNIKLLEGICLGLLETGLNKKIEWYANLRVDQGNEELLKLMWDSGCRAIFYGFESGSQAILDEMNKGCTVEQNYNRAELHKKLRFPYHASIILGYIGETEEDMEQTRKFIKKIKAPFIGINWYVPLPGSADYNMLKSVGYFDNINLNTYRDVSESFESNQVFSLVEKNNFKKLFASIKKEAYNLIPDKVWLDT